MKEPPRPKIGRMIGWTIFGAWVGMWCGYIVPLGPWNSILGGMIALFVASLNENAMTGAGGVPVAERSGAAFLRRGPVPSGFPGPALHECSTLSLRPLTHLREF